MASTYSPILRTELPALGDQAGSWNTTLNSNIGTLLEASIAGTVSHNTAGAGDTTLTTLNGTTDEARASVIKLTGVLTGSHNVICPLVSKQYLVINNTTGAFTITFKGSTGTGVVCPQGSYMHLYCDGTNVTNQLTSTTLLTPTMTAPVLGTPTSGTLTNATGLPLTTGVTGTLPVGNGGTGVTTSTGSGNTVLSTSPTLVTPVLGTPTSGNLANCTFPTLNQNTSGTAANVTGVVGLGNGGTSATGALSAWNNIAGSHSTNNANPGNITLAVHYLMFGSINVTGATQTITFPTGFANGVHAIVCSGTTSGATGCASAITTSNFLINVNSAPQIYHWIAIGY